MDMKFLTRGVALLALASLAACTPEWAKQNAAPYVLEIAAISGGSGDGSAFLSDVGLPVTNDDVEVTVNIFRKNNNGTLGTSAVEHVYLERYDVRYFRSDGQNVEGVDVPFRISGPLGNVRFHTPGPGGETEATVAITLVRHQAKLEPPLRNLQDFGATSPAGGPVLLPGAGVITTIAEVTIHGRTVEGDAMEAKGSVQITFADFP